MLPVVTAGLLFATVGCSVASILNQNIFDALVLVPFRSYAVWTMGTCQFVEASALKVIGCTIMISLTVPLLFVLGRIAERQHGMQKLSMVLLQSVCISSVVAAAIELLNYGITQNVESLFVAVHGTAGLCATLCVAAFQADPEETVGMGVRVKNLPILLLVVLAFTSIVGLSRDIVFLLVGFLSTWTFLRYFAPADEGRFGDLTDGFAFEKLWPEPVRPALRSVVRVTAGLCLRLPCFGGQVQAPTAGTGGAPTSGPGPNAAGRHGGTGGVATGDPLDDPVAQRRRDKAMKALDKRLEEIDQRRKARNHQVKSALTMVDGGSGGGGGGRSGRGVGAVGLGGAAAATDVAKGGRDVEA